MKLKLITLLAIIVVINVHQTQAQSNFFPLLSCSARAYTNATIKSVTPVYALVDWGEGSERVAFTNLPPEIQARYNTMGPSQKIRIVNIATGDQVQIEVEGKIVQAVVHNLPSEMLAFLSDYKLTQGKLNVTLNQLKQDLASTTPANCASMIRSSRYIERFVPHCKMVITAAEWAANNGTRPSMVGGGNSRGAVGGSSRLAAGNANAAINAAAAAAEVRANKEATTIDGLSDHYSDLQNKLSSGYTTIFAKPTGFFASRNTRQWEFQSAANH